MFLAVTITILISCSINFCYSRSWNEIHTKMKVEAYKCESGPFIDTSLLCNGIADCEDASDESKELCMDFWYNFQELQDWKKNYSSVNRRKRQDNSDSGCLLPPHPPNGKYELQSGSTYQANTYVLPSIAITLECNANYTSDSNISFCLTSRWEPALDKNPCLPRCPPLQSTDTYSVQCQLNSKNISCQNPVEGTRAILECKPYYFHKDRQVSYCRDGSWTLLPIPCIPECGKTPVNPQTLDIGVGDAEVANYPWVAAIYKHDGGKKENVCHGIIISRFFILSAADCFTKSKGIPKGISNYTIVAGKYHRDFDIKDNGMQERSIKMLYIYEDYYGYLNKYRNDIALLEVDGLEMTMYVGLVCLDWNNVNEDKDFRENDTAVIIGWNKDAPNLERLIAPLVPVEKCKELIGPSFYENYYTTDSICAAYKGENASVCYGCINGSLYFREASSSSFYVRGIYHVAPDTSIGKFKNDIIIVFTKVSKYLQWIERITQKRGIGANNKQAGCFLPEHPSDGKYEFISGGVYRANTYVSSPTVIMVKCNVNYTSGSTFFTCNSDHWEPPLLNNPCLYICPPLHATETYDVQCQLNFTNISCKKPVQGTIAELICKPHYVHKYSEISACRDGIWDPSPTPCVPECGRKTVNVQTLLIGSRSAEIWEYPWVAAVYNTSLGQKELICGGTIISTLYILSAAHCFTDSEGVPYDKSYFTIVAGKYYRDFDIKENGIQKRSINNLHIHGDYKGKSQKFRDDIALVEVDKLDVTSQVQPACLDWNNPNDENEFRENVTAVIAGWGYITVDSEQPDVLQKLEIPVQPQEQCRKFMDPDFYQQFYSSDKICAGYIGGDAGVCRGDSGSGLYFRRTSSSLFYVRGIVSLARRNQVGCDVNQYALYTKVSKYLRWIQGITLRRF